MTTPNFQYFKNSHPSYAQLGDPRQWEHLQFSADGDGHFYAWHADELEKVFHDAGFADVGHQFFETPFINGHMKLRYLHRRTPQSLLRAADRTMLAIPWLGRALSHQLLVSGTWPGANALGA